jgi:DNA-binding response OmpR family regulator
MQNQLPGPRILIVDDEPSIADSLAVIFSTQMYAAKAAYSAEQAIDIIAEWQPDLAILDVMLPQMNGIDLAIVLQTNHPCCRILLFSGQPDSSLLAEHASKKGYIFNIVAKPVHPSFLLEMAATLLLQPPAPQFPTPDRSA